MVPARPFFIGSDGLVRSRAWIWLFSSTHSTTALSGGFRYSPTTSVSFSRNRLSLETLKVRTTVAGLTPATFAMERVDQWVSPFGFVLVVRRMTSATFCAGMEGLRPRPPSILVRAGGPSWENRRRHRITVGRDTPTSAETPLFDRPLAAARMIRARVTMLWGVLPLLTHRSRSRWSSSEIATARAGCHTATPYRPTLPLSSYL